MLSTKVGVSLACVILIGLLFMVRAWLNRVTHSCKNDWIFYEANSIKSHTEQLIYFAIVCWLIFLMAY